MANQQVYPNRNALIAATAALFQETVTRAIQKQGFASVSLSGGSTPIQLFATLAVEPLRSAIEWPRVHLFWGDERCVPPDHADSNYFQAEQALLRHIAIPPANLHRIPAELPPQQAADTYERKLREFFQTPTGPPVRSTFDLLILGLGEDAHTASLFPGSPVLNERERWVAAVYVPKLAAWRITLTPVVLNAASQVRFLVSGAEKRPALQQVRDGEYLPERYPAQIIQPATGDLVWLLDQAAA